MEIRHLRSFVVAAEGEHFRRAADILRLPQPAISRHIKSLEEDLGLALFERVGRRMRLSIAGRFFLEDAKRILQELDRASDRARRVASGQVGTLRIGCNEPGSGYPVVLETMRAFREASPEVAVDLILMDSLPQVDALRTGQIDAGFIYRDARTGDGLDFRCMAEEHLLLAVPQAHPLNRKRNIKLTDLRGEPLIFLARSIAQSFYDLLVASCVAQGLSPKIVQEARSATMILNLVSVGMGIGFVSSAMRGRQSADVTLKPIPELKIPLHFDLVWRQGNAYPALMRFIELATKKAGGFRPAGRRN